MVSVMGQSNDKERERALNSRVISQFKLLSLSLIVAIPAGDAGKNAYGRAVDGFIDTPNRKSSIYDEIVLIIS